MTQNSVSQDQFVITVATITVIFNMYPVILISCQLTPLANIVTYSKKKK